MGVRSNFGGFAPLVLLLLVFGAPVVACGDTTPIQLTSPGVAHNASKAVPDTVLTTAPPRPGGPVVGDTVPVGPAGGSVTVSATEAHVNAGRLFPAGKGKDYYAVQVKACSAPSENGLSFKPQYFTLEMADKTVHEAGAGVKKPDLRSGVVPAGGCLDGWVTFVIPEKSQPAFVVYDGSEQLRWQIPPESSKKAGR
jgi:hypothetical protein